MIIFWCALGLVVYTYVGYPLLLTLIRVFFTRKSFCADVNEISDWPTVTIIVAAYNEEKSIRDKITNILALDYPEDKRNILVASDGSDDQTDSIVESFSGDSVSLIRVEGRKGKTEAQNVATKHAEGEILVFTDATTHLREDSLKHMVSCFEHDDVGCVGGKLIYCNDKESNTGEGNIAYWEYETYIKSIESQISSLIGVSGCYYAVRKDLYEDIDPALISDFVVAQNVFEKGYRSVFQPNAVCTETALDDYREEFNMRIRVAVRSYGAIFKKLYLLNIFKYGFYSIQLFSHKVLRYMIPIFLIAIFLSNLSLLDNPFYLFVFIMQLMFYAFAVLGYFAERHLISIKVFKIPFYFMLVNISALFSLFKYAAGSRKIIWTPNR